MNNKWVVFYRGTKTTSSDIYDFKIKRDYIKTLNTEHKSDTLKYSILEYSDRLLSLIHIPRGNILNYKPLKK
ncbi:conserved hypothetical protein [Tenacibaculum amylolyticum]